MNFKFMCCKLESITVVVLSYFLKDGKVILTINNVMIEKKLQTTLRLHSAPITCIEPFYLPSTITYSTKNDIGINKENLIFNQSLLTADESGLIIWWNLSTHRPLGIWKAHDDSILTVQQLGVKWDTDNKHNFNIPEISKSYGQLLTHSKDGTIKIWNLINLFNIDDMKSGFTYSCFLKKKLITSDENAKYISPPLLFEMPVNTLNFSNVELNFIGLLLTPATTESEGWDLYKIDLDQPEEYLKLKRLIQNHKVNLSSSIEELNDQGDPDNESNVFTKRGNTGVIMKFCWIDSNRFIVGYESGDLIGFQIISNLEGDNSNFKAKKFLHIKNLDGNPITSIVIDRVNNKILCSSTGSKICIIDLSNSDYKSKIFETKHKGIGDISCDPYTKSVGIVTWDGYTRIYEEDKENILKFDFKMRRQLPAISNSKEIVDNQNGEVSQINNLQTQRANKLKFTEKQMDPYLNKDSAINIMYNNGRSKNVIKKNREEMFGERWLFVGYQDGKVSMYSIH